MDSYKNIYTNIINEVNTLVDSLQETKDDKIKEYKTKALNKLTSLQNELNEELTSLLKNSNWSTFTIAFYGETNAGKSTIIETLRILLEEPTKTEARKQYIEANKRYNNHINNLNILTNKEIQLEKEKQQLDQSYLETIITSNHCINELIDLWLEKQLTIYCLNQSIINEMTTSLSSFLNIVFNKLNLLEKVKQEQLQLNNIKDDYKEKINELENIKSDILNNFNQIKENQIQIQNDILETNNQIVIEKNNLQEYSDGKIIHASNDFTKTIQEYTFTYKNTKFKLLDLPGIEGKEELVIDEIEKAIETAHVVLFISSSPYPPQSGSNEDTGTINKIKKQLSKQSEVYFIFNKKIHHPRQIKETILNKQEKESLKDVDYQMNKILDENYKGHISLCTLLAYLVLCFEDNEKTKRSKNKFLSRYSENDLLDKSGILSFSDWLTCDLINDYKKKIVRSNFKKIKVSLVTTINNIKELYCQFDEFDNKLKDDYKNISDQLDNYGYQYINDIDTFIRREIQHFKMNTKKEALALIDQDISDRALNKGLKKIIDKNKKSFKNNINFGIKERSQSFEKDISDYSHANAPAVADCFTTPIA